MDQRERLMLAGLFLSKFGKKGLLHFGFSSYSEAYNAMGYALGGRPASIKNYMQEFDPLFPNGRKGWHKRDTRDHCREAFERYGEFSITELSGILSPLLLNSESMPSLPDELREIQPLTDDTLANPSLSKRLITGLAAENYFEKKFTSLPEFEGCDLSNVTRFGCGFDFRMQPSDPKAPFLAAEVKGMRGPSGEIQLTSKEHRVAGYLKDRYFLCVVRNFSEQPLLSVFRNPLDCGLRFEQRKRIVSALTWHTRLPD